MENLNKVTILTLCLIFTLLNSCKGLKENLTLKKKANTDEFLVQKKNPLILPPNYEDLPKPTNQKKVEDQDEKEIDFSKIFKDSENTNIEKNSDINQELEHLIRKEIGTN